METFQDAAPPLLGSTLLANEVKLDISRPRPVSSGNNTIDKAVLDGGIRYGEITSVAGANGTGKTLLAFQTIASHLIAYKVGEVALIATTDPPLARLRDILVSRLTRQHREPEFRQSGYVYHKQGPTVVPFEDIQSRVASLLERVRLCRVFDFPGVAEAIGEFSARLEENNGSDGHRTDRERLEKAHVIADSEDEAESSLSPELVDSAIGEPDMAKAKAMEHLPASMIVIDNIANVVGSLMTKSQAQGHAMLASFINTVVGLRSQSTQYHRKADDQVSVFSSTVGKPALGKHFSYLVGTSIFLSTLPRSKDDADIAYNDGSEAKNSTKVGVIEILKDRHGSREGRWGAFTTVAGIELQDVHL
ncbi:MAG: hypothetical protein Q9213_001929 [Squamulea squamosa]